MITLFNLSPSRDLVKPEIFHTNEMTCLFCNPGVFRERDGLFSLQTHDTDGAMFPAMPGIVLIWIQASKGSPCPEEGQEEILSTEKVYIKPALL